MSLKALFIASALAVLAWPSAGHAEKATANQPAKVFSRAGEQAPVLVNVKPGQVMTILAKDGRWIKVRVSGRTGWVPRSKVDLPKDDDAVVRNTTRRPFVDGRGTNRGFGGQGGPNDRVGADATGEGVELTKEEKEAAAAAAAKGDKGDKGSDGEKGGDGAKIAKGDKPDAGETAKPDGEGEGEGDSGQRAITHVSKAATAYKAPDPKTEAMFAAQPKTTLYLIETKGKWTYLENEEGDKGYVLTSQLEPMADAVATVDTTTRRRMIDIHGRIGASVVSQQLATANGGVDSPPDNYTAASPSFAVALGAAGLWPVGERLWFGAELGYDMNMAVGGVEYLEKSTSFMYHVLNARVALGYDLQGPRGTAVLARLGFHYDAFQVSNVGDFATNTVKLPNQNIMAPTIGLALLVPRLGQKTTFKMSVDAIVAGASVEQTKNLEDGTDPSAKAIYAGLAVGYHWKPRIDLLTTVDFGYTSLSFGGPPPSTSLRNHMGTGKITGADINAVLSFGMGYTF